MSNKPEIDFLLSEDWLSTLTFVLTCWDLLFWFSIGLGLAVGFIGSVTGVDTGAGLSTVGEGVGVTFVCTVSLVSSVADVSLFFSFSLFEWTSSNHFSKMGIASSKFGVPEEEIFCFPSI